jgi:hypothetical protein
MKDESFRPHPSAFFISSSTRSTSSAELQSISSTSASHSRSPAQSRRVASAMRQPLVSNCGSACSIAARIPASPRAAATIAVIRLPKALSMCQRWPSKAAKVARSRWRYSRAASGQPSRSAMPARMPNVFQISDEGSSVS